MQGMEIHSYWQSLWETADTPWHRSTAHPFLTEHSKNIDFTPPKRVFLPLCGKCPELLWFYKKELEVVGVEMIELPVKEFFKECNLEFQVRELSWAKVYETPDKRLKIYISNIFDINIDDIGKFDIIWESGVQTVLKIEDRERYSKLMRTLCKDEFKYLLHTLQHEGNVDAIPRPISHEIIQKIFDDWCRIEFVVQSQYMNPYLKSQGVNIAFQSYHLLTPK